MLVYPSAVEEKKEEPIVPKNTTVKKKAPVKKATPKAK